MGISGELSAAQLKQMLWRGRGGNAESVVALMDTRGLGCVDFYEVRYT